MSKQHKPNCTCARCLNIRLTRAEQDILNLKRGFATIISAAEEGARLIKEEEGK